MNIVTLKIVEGPTVRSKAAVGPNQTGQKLNAGMVDGGCHGVEGNQNPIWLLSCPCLAWIDQSKSLNASSSRKLCCAMARSCGT